MKNISYFAFTIAEILIVLLVIGIIFTLCLPSLRWSYEKNVTQAGFNDIMKETNKAFLNYSRRSHCQGRLDCTDLFAPNTNDTAQKLSETYIHGRVGNNCWNGLKINNNLDGSGADTDLKDLSCFVSINERIYATQTLSNCTTNLYNSAGNPPRNKLQNACGYLFVDINGIKAPNRFGRDVFIFIITNSPPSYLYPLGGNFINPAVSYENLGNWVGTCGDGTQEGRTCGGRIVEEGMKVKYLE